MAGYHVVLWWLVHLLKEGMGGGPRHRGHLCAAVRGQVFRDLAG